MEWKRVGNHEVSENGDLRRKKPNGEYFVYAQTESNGGYLTSGGKGVHQWVAMAFLGHTPNKHKIVVHHKDGNPKNNHVSNLELISQTMNVLEKKKSTTSIYPFVYYCSKLNKFKVHMKAEGKIRYYGAFNNEDDAGKVARTLCEIYRPDVLEEFDNL